MNELATKWCEALRSGNYAQGKNSLQSVFGSKKTYCCFGVLCDIIDPDAWTQTQKGEMSWGGRVFKPPGSARKMVGIDFVQPMDELIMMNDQDNKTFSEIANAIESLLS